jgi:hypothetical protein
MIEGTNSEIEKERERERQTDRQADRQIGAKAKRWKRRK